MYFIQMIKEQRICKDVNKKIQGISMWSLNLFANTQKRVQKVKKLSNRHWDVCIIYVSFLFRYIHIIHTQFCILFTKLIHIDTYMDMYIRINWQWQTPCGEESQKSEMVCVQLGQVLRLYGSTLPPLKKGIHLFKFYSSKKENKGYIWELSEEL